MYIDEAHQFHDAALPAHNPDPLHSKTYEFALFLVSCILVVIAKITLYLIAMFFPTAFVIPGASLCWWCWWRLFRRAGGKHYMIFFCLFLSIFYGVDEDIYGGSCASRGASIKRLHPRQRGHEMCSLTGRVTIKMSRQWMRAINTRIYARHYIAPLPHCASYNIHSVSLHIPHLFATLLLRHIWTFSSSFDLLPRTNVSLFCFDRNMWDHGTPGQSYCLAIVTLWKSAAQARTADGRERGGILN